MKNRERAGAFTGSFKWARIGYDGAEPLQAARDWIAENEDIVDGWLQ